MNLLKDTKLRMFVIVTGCNIIAYIFLLIGMKILGVMALMVGILFLRKCLWGTTHKKILKQDVKKIIEEEIEDALRGNVATEEFHKTYAHIWGDLVVPSIPPTKIWYKRILKYF